MALIGTAAIVMWNHTQDPAATAHWHSQEHLRERIACPGFLRARRMICPEPAGTEHFMLYELSDLSAAGSQTYRDRLNDPSEWSQRMMATVIAHSRTTCVLRRRAGLGVAAQAIVGRFAQPMSPATAADLDRFLDMAGSVPEVTGIAWLDRAGATGGGMTQEQRLRGRPDSTVEAAFVVESFDRPRLERLIQEGAFPGAVTKLFQLDHLVGAADL